MFEEFVLTAALTGYVSELVVCDPWQSTLISHSARKDDYKMPTTWGRSSRSTSKSIVQHYPGNTGPAWPENTNHYRMRRTGRTCRVSGVRISYR